MKTTRAAFSSTPNFGHWITGRKTGKCRKHVHNMFHPLHNVYWTIGDFQKMVWKWNTLKASWHESWPYMITDIADITDSTDITVIDVATQWFSVWESWWITSLGNSRVVWVNQCSGLSFKCCTGAGLKCFQNVAPVRSFRHKKELVKEHTERSRAASTTACVILRRKHQPQPLHNCTNQISISHCPCLFRQNAFVQQCRTKDQKLKCNEFCLVAKRNCNIPCLQCQRKIGKVSMERMSALWTAPSVRGKRRGCTKKYGCTSNRVVATMTSPIHDKQ